MTTQRWRTLGLVALVVLLTVAVWEKRGAAVGLVALAVYGGLVLSSAMSGNRVETWFARHRLIDATVIAPLLFLALALLTGLPTLVCATIGAAAAALFVPLVAWRRGGTDSQEPVAPRLRS